MHFLHSSRHQQYTPHIIPLAHTEHAHFLHPRCGRNQRYRKSALVESLIGSSCILFLSLMLTTGAPFSLSFPHISSPHQQQPRQQSQLAAGWAICSTMGPLLHRVSSLDQHACTDLPNYPFLSFATVGPGPSHILFACFFMITLRGRCLSQLAWLDRNLKPADKMQRVRCVCARVVSVYVCVCVP